MGVLDAFTALPDGCLRNGGYSRRYGAAGYGDDFNVLRVFVSQLRRKIEPDADRPQVIVTDPGVGYRWVLRPAEAASPGVS